MAYCKNCGTQVAEDARFCQMCGCPTDNNQRHQEYAGKVFKCPNCGEVLQSFEINCPTCGYELRGTKVTSAVKEFALKLEEIESKREYEKPHGFFNSATALQTVSKTDAQKISLIKSFSVPNTKEDMLEFMILATSNMNMRVYDALGSVITKGDKELNDAWFAKVQQVYEKAKRIYSSDNTFLEIQKLYDKCIDDIKRAKKKNILKWVLTVGWIPIAYIFLFVLLSNT